MTAHWRAENPIPDSALIYMRAHRENVDKDGGLMPRVFRDRDGGMSTDWQKYSTPQQTRDRGRTPAANGVISLNVGGVRLVPMTVNHTPVQPGSTDKSGAPILPNQAHTDVVGTKDSETRLKLLRLARWEIQLVG